MTAHPQRDNLELATLAREFSRAVFPSANVAFVGMMASLSECIGIRKVMGIGAVPGEVLGPQRLPGLHRVFSTDFSAGQIRLKLNSPCEYHRFRSLLHFVDSQYWSKLSPRPRSTSRVSEKPGAFVHVLTSMIAFKFFLRLPRRGLGTLVWQF